MCYFAKQCRRIKGFACTTKDTKNAPPENRFRRLKEMFILAFSMALSETRLVHINKGNKINYKQSNSQPQAIPTEILT